MSAIPTWRAARGHGGEVGPAALAGPPRMFSIADPLRPCRAPRVARRPTERSTDHLAEHGRARVARLVLAARASWQMYRAALPTTLADGLGLPIRGHPGKLLADRREIGAAILEDGGGDALIFDEQAEQDVLGADVAVARAPGWPYHRANPPEQPDTSSGVSLRWGQTPMDVSAGRDQRRLRRGAGCWSPNPTWLRPPPNTGCRSR
jgi:hypothetical protein